MATEESNIVQRCRMAASKCGARLFRNNRGLFVTTDSLKMIHAVAMDESAHGVLQLLNSGRLRKVRAGLEVPGSSDLIGWKTIRITPDMVGKDIAVFLGLEGKTEIGKASAEQNIFIENVLKAGGIAGIARNEDDAINLINHHKF
jgi:hypothetical protein